MRIDDEESTPDTEATVVSDPSDTEAEDAGDKAEPREKVIVRSDGTVTYVGKDMPPVAMQIAFSP